MNQPQYHTITVMNYITPKASAKHDPDMMLQSRASGPRYLFAILCHMKEQHKYIYFSLKTEMGLLNM